MEKVIKYECENDVTLKVFSEDGKVDEIWVTTPADVGWTVIGYDELLKAIDLAKKATE